MWLARWVLVCVLIYHISCSVPACSAESARCCNIGEYENHVSTYILVLVWYVLLIQFILNRSLLSITKKYSMVLLQLVLVVATGTKFGDRLIFIVSFSICVNVCMCVVVAYANADNPYFHFINIINLPKLWIATTRRSNQEKFILKCNLLNK